MAANKPEVRYTTETTLGLDEYKKYVRTMQGSQLKNNIIAAVACIWLIAAGAFNIYNAKTVLGVFMIVVGVGAPILVRVGANNQSERDFEKIREAGGFSESESEHDNNYNWYNNGNPGNTRYLSITARIPSEKFEAFMDSLSGDGKVMSRSVNAENISTRNPMTFARGSSRETAE